MTTFFTENQIWALLDEEFNLWEASYSETVAIRRGFQPTQQSTPAGYFAYLFQIMNKKYGWQAGIDTWNSGTSTMDHVERYIINKTIQVSTQDITDPSSIGATSGDVAESIAAWLNSFPVINRLKSRGVEILRITDVRHPHFVNDFNNYDGNPNFDFIISYTQEVQSEGVAVDNVRGNLYNECSVPQN